jgi:hypothetical protein
MVIAFSPAGGSKEIDLDHHLVQDGSKRIDVGRG